MRKTKQNALSIGQKSILRLSISQINSLIKSLEAMGPMDNSVSSLCSYNRERYSFTRTRNALNNKLKRICSP